MVTRKQTPPTTANRSISRCLSTSLRTGSGSRVMMVCTKAMDPSLLIPFTAGDTHPRPLGCPRDRGCHQLATDHANCSRQRGPGPGRGVHWPNNSASNRSTGPMPAHGSFGGGDVVGVRLVVGGVLVATGGRVDDDPGGEVVPPGLPVGGFVVVGLESVGGFEVVGLSVGLSVGFGLSGGSGQLHHGNRICADALAVPR